MIIKSSTSLRNEYAEISNICKQSGEPVFLTKNGEGDLVIMSIEEYSYREELLDLKERILEAEEQRISGAKLYTQKEVDEIMERIVNAVPKRKNLYI